MNCDICNKLIKHPKNWIRHCNTKKHIRLAIQVSQGITEVSQKVSQSNPEVSQSNPEVSQKVSQSITNSITDTTKHFDCKYCDKTFNKKNNMYRHMKHYCKEKPQATTIINNTTNNIVHQHVHINIYGQEDFSKIMNKLTYDSVKDLDGIELARKLIPIMWNTAPNNTVQIPNMNQPYALTMGVNGIEKKSLSPIIEEIINGLPYHIRKMFHNYYKQTKHEYENVVEWLKEKSVGNRIINDFKKMCKDEKIGKEIKKIIKATLYNNNISIK